MLNSSRDHLQEIAKILAGPIERIEDSKAVENENVEPENEIALDLSADSSVTVDR